MTWLADLHLHSTASDGQYRPEEVVRLAAERGLQVIALTDHDTLSGFGDARAEGERQGVRVLPGIEMGAVEYPTFHLLGYGFDPDDRTLWENFSGLKAMRQKRKQRIVTFLREKGVDIPVSEVDALVGSGAVGRPHFAQVMLRHGFCRTWKEVFDRYLDTPEFHAWVNYDKLTARECIQKIKGAGGVVSLAHPYQIGLDDGGLDRLVGQLKDWGLDAIECWHSGHTPEMTAAYLALAEKYGLHLTGGSDFHGEKIKPEVAMAALPLELEWLPGF